MINEDNIIGVLKVKMVYSNYHCYIEYAQFKKGVFVPCVDLSDLLPLLIARKKC